MHGTTAKPISHSVSSWLLSSLVVVVARIVKCVRGAGSLSLEGTIMTLAKADVFPLMGFPAWNN